ncbi:unnamed protein product [Moneuplotes crassus]|uniref:Uncharacterized protein n=1 Tax=Euplotes crassus TaxID=5936 RepID=A0AAD1US56_EUPCR|nr:unnamed protein product [Moneuplotes crassus]
MEHIPASENLDNPNYIEQSEKYEEERKFESNDQPLTQNSKLLTPKSHPPTKFNLALKLQTLKKHQYTITQIQKFLKSFGYPEYIEDFIQLAQIEQVLHILRQELLPLSPSFCLSASLPFNQIYASTCFTLEKLCKRFDKIWKTYPHEREEVLNATEAEGLALQK